MLSPLTFPPPHRLSRQPGTRSLTLSTTHPQTVDTSTQPVGGSQSVACTSTSSHPAPLVEASLSHGTSDVFADNEETDSGPPQAKRVKRLVAMPVQLLTHGGKTKKSEPIVQTYNGKPLKSFSLYLPLHLPASVVTDTAAFASYALTTAATYLGLWNLDKSLEAVDVRLPPQYSERLQSDPNFLPAFLGIIFESLCAAKSIKELYLPQVFIQNTSCLGLHHTFEALSKTTCIVKHAYLPLAFSIEPSDLVSLDLTKIAKVVQAVRAVKKITFVSSSDTLELFSDLFNAQVESSIDFSISNHEASVPGPEYLTDLSTSPPLGEKVDPHTLVASLNTISAGSKKEGGTSWSGGNSRSQRKRNMKRAFTTDCSYTENAQISSEDTYASKLWDLERLHASGIDGSGTTIAVLDSGINYTSPAFKDKVIAIRNFVPNSIDDIDCAIDSDGHGSLCAGIAASSSFYCPISEKDSTSPCLKIPPGVAPGAKLIICKVVDTTSGDVNTAAFLEALIWLKEIHVAGTAINVVSISLASSYFSHERATVISDLVSLGVIVVCCASNVGRMKMQPISYPARLGHVLCIGSHDDNGKPASFSPVGRELDFLAPGEDMWGPGPGTKGPFAMDCGSGTSCSTPAIAGLICLVLHDIRQRCLSVKDDKVDTTIAGRQLTEYVKSVWVMRELLKEMSSSPGHHSEEIGYGTLNPYRLLDSNTEEIVRIVNEIIEDED